MFYPESVVHIRALAVADRYGSQARSWSTATETTISGVQVQPSESTEPREGNRSSVVTHMRLIGPVGTQLDLEPTDRVRWGGVLWQVEGEVAHHKRPSTGAIHHTEATLLRVAG